MLMRVLRKDRQNWQFFLQEPSNIRIQPLGGSVEVFLCFSKFSFPACLVLKFFSQI